MKGTNKHRLMQELGWEDLKTRRAIHKLLLYFKIVNNFCPSYTPYSQMADAREKTGTRHKNEAF